MSSTRSPSKRERDTESATHFYHIGDVVTLTGLSADAIRAWERVDLLTPHRSASGIRQFTEDDLARIRLIARTLQQGGYSRRAVAQLLQSGDLRPDAADYAPGPARLRRSRRLGRSPRRSLRGDGGEDRSSGPGSMENAPWDQEEQQDEVRSERLTLNAVARINDALASGRPLEEVLQVICSEACQAFGVSASVLWLAVPPLLVAAAAYGPHSAATPLSAELRPVPHALPLDDQRAPAVRAYHTRRGLIVNTERAFSSSSSSSPAYPELTYTDGVPGTTALLVVPLLATNGAPIGALSLTEALNPERFDTDDLERVRLFAVQATLAIETARLHTEIRIAREQAEEHRARWQAAVDDLPVLVCICDSTLTTTYVSPTCGQVLGWPLATSDDFTSLREPRLESSESAGSQSWEARYGFFWLGQVTPRVIVTSGVTDLDLVHVRVTQGELPLPRALYENRAVHDITIAHRCPDGLERLISWDAAPMRTNHEELSGAVAVGRDVTQEHRQREREACLAAVTHAAAGAPGAGGIEGRANRVLSALVTHTRKPVLAATLYLLDEETDMLRRVGTFGVEQSGTHAPAVPLTREHPWWHMLIGGPVYSSPDGAQPRWLRTIGLVVWKASSIRAWATVPLHSGEKLVGALSIGLSAPHSWDVAERAWLEACADAVMMGVENDRLLAAEQRKSSALAALLAVADPTRTSNYP